MLPRTRARRARDPVTWRRKNANSAKGLRQAPCVKAPKRTCAPARTQITTSIPSPPEGEIQPPAHRRMPDSDPSAPSVHQLVVSDWAFGLFVLVVGLFLPLTLARRKLFGGGKSGAKRSR